MHTLLTLRKGAKKRGHDKEGDAREYLNFIAKGKEKEGEENREIKQIKFKSNSLNHTSS